MKTEVREREREREEIADRKKQRTAPARGLRCHRSRRNRIAALGVAMGLRGMGLEARKDLLAALAAPAAAAGAWG